MTALEKRYKDIAVSIAKANPNRIQAQPHCGVLYVDGGAFVEICVYVDKEDLIEPHGTTHQTEHSTI